MMMMMHLALLVVDGRRDVDLRTGTATDIPKLIIRCCVVLLAAGSRVRSLPLEIFFCFFAFFSWSVVVRNDVSELSAPRSDDSDGELTPRSHILSSLSPAIHKTPTRRSCNQSRGPGFQSCRRLLPSALVSQKSGIHKYR